MINFDLYRYLPDEAAVTTITSGAFRVSRLADLNDPFEWRFGFEGCPSHLEEDVQNRMQSFVEHAGKNMGILSFTKIINDPVIWSHYTKVHQGIALKVNPNINVNLANTLHEVDYDKPRVVLPYRRMRDEEILQRLENFFKQKSKSWEYERECRWVIGHESCVPFEGRFYWRIPKDFITHVVIGWRSQFTVKGMADILNSNDLKNVKIQIAKPSMKSYDIEILDVK